MTTTFVDAQAFRRNMTKISNEARKKKRRVVVMRKREPLFEIQPLSHKEILEAKLLRDIQEAEESIRAGKVYSLEEVEKSLGL